ncbi:hypothetical protein [Phaeobacter inhibens]|uniref:hypothetical protein n=1 Tax=Phaeobacter inhibens TaxID=221822 RepID=UPI000C9BA4D5|nr:hypothetical protein [Phaeobacter inhibens]AUQ64395.1 hypothetical protein PhaeoP51_03464 [Phaeobacter inhibens]
MTDTIKEAVRPYDEQYDTIKDVEQDPTGAMMAIHELVAQRDALRAQLQAARDEALEEAASIFDEEAAHDWGGIDYSEAVGIPICNRADLVKSAKRAEENARLIRALKSTSTEGEG